MDGNWKLCYPICMYRVPKEISGFDGALQYVDSCPNQPVPGMAFCTEHCMVADSEGVPCSLKDFIKYSGVKGINCTEPFAHHIMDMRMDESSIIF